MIKTYCFKMYGRKQNKRLVALIELAAEIYNHCIALHKRYYKLYKTHLNKNKLQAHIAKLKKLDRYKHWYELNSQAIQEITDRIERAYTLFFRNLTRKVRTAPPGFKRRKKYKSFTLKLRGYKLLKTNTGEYDNTVFIMGRKYKFFKSREIKGTIKTVTVKRNKLGDLYIYFVCETDNADSKIKTVTGKIAGFEFGFKTYLKAVNINIKDINIRENDIESPSFFKKNQSAVKKLNRSFSRKQKNSNGMERVKRKLYKQQYKIANQRKDFQFKLANELCGKYDAVYIKEPDMKSMRKSWGKKILDLAHGNFYGILKHQSLKYGVTVSEFRESCFLQQFSG